jgi:hypothetical protein
MRIRKHKKKYCIIAKVAGASSGFTFFVKYRSENLENFFIFLNKKYHVYYANIFSNKGADENKLIFTYGKHKGLQHAY